jgi:hypothetical protein
MANDQGVQGLTRAAARKLLGEPEASGDKGGTGVFALEHSWDRWLILGQLLHVVYDGDGETAGTITQSDPPPPEPVSIELQIYADYYQFYVQDMESTCDTSVIWDDPASTEQGAVVGEGLVAVSTKRYETVPVRVEWYPSDPGFDWEGIDRVNECGIEVRTRLGVGMPISLRPLHHIEFVEPGIYDVRLMAWGLDTVVSDWDGGDHYIVQLWPAATLRPLTHLAKP